MNITNPVIRGFNPDPSIIRVKDDYYIATSTFEWWPGIQLHHSRDLVNWRLVNHAITRKSMLNLRGVPDSGGIWAPSLSYADEQFFLVFANVRTCGKGMPYKDMHVYITTAEDICGQWSKPVRLNSIGFDPALFHDDDGRKWLLNMMWDYRKDNFSFAGIVIQEYDNKRQTLFGPPIRILQKDKIVCEGPKMFKKDGWYYLMTADGGTGTSHGVALARSRSITGPYELDPHGDLMTTRDDFSIELQKAGHGELVQTQNGEWYLSHLASRPVTTEKGCFCVLGRETCIQKVKWSDDGWLRLAQGGHHPAKEIPAPTGLEISESLPIEETDCFDSSELDINWSSLRGPVDDSWLSLKERPGWCRIHGRESLCSNFEQSLIAKRLQNFSVNVETCLEFTPNHFTQMAGLVCYYDTGTHYYLRVTYDEKIGKVLGIIVNDDSTYDELTDAQININSWQQIFLRAVIRYEKLQFYASPDGKNWQMIGTVLDMTKISDDYGNNLRFTGAMMGLCVQDIGGAETYADFNCFKMIFPENTEVF